MLLTVEGLDGSGTTTLANAIGERWLDATVTSEPTDLRYGQLIRSDLSDDTSNELIDFYLFMADRINHIEERVRPIDENGGLVVSDRYIDSTRAYQPVALSRSDYFASQWQAKQFIEQTMEPWSYEPDLTIYIDVSVETALQRAAGDDKYEHRSFLEDVKANYDALAESDEFGDRIVRVDGEQSKESVRAAVFSVIEDRA